MAEVAGDASPEAFAPPEVASEAYPSMRDGVAAERLAVEARPQPQMHDLPLRQYLDTYVVPTLMPGLKAVADERPDNPVEWLAYYLLQNNRKRQEAAAADAAAKDPADEPKQDS
eukprot:TRINITY_DN63587_c0_g1_i1.p2 TRINITY_DN63587_c0_g1~~TRINITY_DN63587_c0_g1_i1.p2  ORF type:complete len:114 (-),score=34.57 TRINITY_DN63587_c0_g1_i1:132-473(-)